MHRGRTVYVVVPAYNEAPRIGRVLTSMPPCVDAVIVVDDASDDGTAGAAHAIGDARVDVVTHRANGGVGTAIATGYERFLARTSDPDAVVVVMAGDAQMDPADLPALLDAVDARIGYAKGNRFRMGGTLRVMPLGRIVGNLVLSALTRLATGYRHLGDSQCGYTAMRRATVARLDLQALYPRYGFPNDVLLKLAALGERVADVPVRAIYADEISGIAPFRVVPRIMGILWRGRHARRRGVAADKPGKPERPVAVAER